MRHIKQYQIFESEPIRTVFSKEQLNWLDKCVDGSWKYNPQTGLVDVEGQFYCHNQGLADFKGVRFGKVRGDFGCESNQLTSLEGAPQTVGGDFTCYKNRLTSLEGAPQTVGKNFDCSRNQLTTLEGAPQSVESNFRCDHNPVSSGTLKGIFELMKNGKPYQQAVDEFWPEMEDEDRTLMYKQMPDLSPEDVRKYNALTKLGNIKGYL